jgi:hypothetical protein
MPGAAPVYLKDAEAHEASFGSLRLDAQVGHECETLSGGFLI